MNADGRCTLTVSQDLLSVSLSLYPPAPSGKAVEIADIEILLHGEGVVFGINWERIRDLLSRCNTSQERFTDEIIGRGREPQAAIPPSLYYSPVLQKLSPVFRQIDAAGKVIQRSDEGDIFARDLNEVGGRIDHRETQSITVIHQDQLLARPFAGNPGVAGCTVTGEDIAAGELTLVQLKPGKNTRVDDEGRVFSDLSGRFVWDNASFGVDDTIEIAGDIGYKTGNIRFPGNISLKGTIQDRFRIWLGGNLLATSTIDAYEIFCKGELKSTEGIIGKGKSLVRAKAGVEAKFIQNCRVESFGEISVKKYISGSEVSSQKGIHIEKGRIIGGHTRFGTTCTVLEAGNPAGVPTVLEGGCDFVAIRLLEYSRKRVTELTLELQKLESTASPAKKMEAIRGEITSLHKQQEDLLEATIPDSSSYLEVLGTVHSGVVVRFGLYELVIRSEMSNKRFYPDASSGTVRHTSAGSGNGEGSGSTEVDGDQV